MKIIIAITLFCIGVINISTQVRKNDSSKNFTKCSQLTEEQQFSFLIQYIIQHYGKSFYYYNELKTNSYEFVQGKNSSSYLLRIYSLDKDKKKVSKEIKLKKIIDTYGKYTIFFEKGEIENLVNQKLFDEMHLDGTGYLVTIRQTDNMLYDRMILQHDEIPGYYWYILNRSFTMANLEDQNGDEAQLFKNIEAGVVVPFGENFDYSKVLTVDSEFESIIYFDGNVVNVEGSPINKVYGSPGIGNGNFSHPTGITKGRPIETEEYLIYPIFIADQYNFRIGKVNLNVSYSSSQLSSIDGSSYTCFRMIFPFDISYFVSPTSENNDKIWVCEACPYNPNLSCLTPSGQKIQTFKGYLDSNTNQVYLFEEGTKSRLNVYSNGFNAISFVDNIRNTLVSCLLKNDGTAYAIPYGTDTLILANDLLTFPETDIINSVSFQSTSISDASWPTLWITSDYKIHNVRMNNRAHTQYLGSTSLPNNSQSNLRYLKNTIAQNNIIDFVTVERWSSNSYGLRRYVPYIDYYDDTLYSYCEDSVNLMRWKGTLTNDCWLYLRPKRKNKQGGWDNVIIKELNGMSVNDTCYVKWQLAGWNQGSEDLYIDLKLDLPIEDYALEGQVKLYIGFFPEYNFPDIHDPNFWDLMHENKTYETTVRKTCLPKPGGCPFLFVKNNEGDFQAENNVLHRMEFSESGIDISDLYKIQTPFQITNDEFVFYLVENESDSGYIDYVRVLAVDYPFNKKFGITEDNKIVLYDSLSVLPFDSVMLNATNITSNVHYFTHSQTLTNGYTGDSLYAHLSYPDKRNRTVVQKSNLKQNEVYSNQNDKNRAVSKNTRTGPDINYPIAFITDLRNLANPIPNTKDTAGFLTATSIFSNTVSKMFARRELGSIVILPLFNDTDLVDHLTIDWQSDFRMKYLGIANLSYSGYTLTEIPMSVGTYITATNETDITSLLIADDDERGAVNPSGLIKMTFNTADLQPPGLNDVRAYVIEIRGQYISVTSQTDSKKAIEQIPVIYSLSQNYPNPFNPKTKINFELPKNDRVNLVVYDILGREVIRLVNNEFKHAGKYTVEFNAQNYASGVYFYRIEAGDFVQAKKMVLVK